MNIGFQEFIGHLLTFLASAVVEAKRSRFLALGRGIKVEAHNIVAIAGTFIDPFDLFFQSKVERAQVSEYLLFYFWKYLQENIPRNKVFGFFGL
jgi:predicted N-acyltransferase